MQVRTELCILFGQKRNNFFKVGDLHSFRQVFLVSRREGNSKVHFLYRFFYSGL